jgi:excisionase family DNA binding protein
MTNLEPAAARFELTPRQAAVTLRCSPATIYRAVHRGELEAVRLGERGTIRIRDDALEKFMQPVVSRDEK